MAPSQREAPDYGPLAACASRMFIFGSPLNLKTSGWTCGSQPQRQSPGTLVSEYPAFFLGLIVGVTALGLLVLGLVNCFILVQKKSKALLPSYFQTPCSPHCFPGCPDGGGAGTKLYTITDSNGSGDCSSLGV